MPHHSNCFTDSLFGAARHPGGCCHQATDGAGGALATCSRRHLLSPVAIGKPAPLGCQLVRRCLARDTLPVVRHATPLPEPRENGGRAACGEQRLLWGPGAHCCCCCRNSSASSVASHSVKLTHESRQRRVALQLCITLPHLIIICFILSADGESVSGHVAQSGRYGRLRTLHRRLLFNRVASCAAGELPSPAQSPSRPEFLLTLPRARSLLRQQLLPSQVVTRHGAAGLLRGSQQGPEGHHRR